MKIEFDTKKISGIKLQLDRQEMFALAQILGKVSGPSSFPQVALADKVYAAIAMELLSSEGAPDLYNHPEYPTTNCGYLKFSS